MSPPGPLDLISEPMGARPFHVGISLSFAIAASSSSDQQLKSSAAQHLRQFPTRGVGSGLSPAQFSTPRVTWFPTLAIVLDSRRAWFWTLAARVPDSWECSSRLSWVKFPNLLLSSRLQFLDSSLDLRCLSVCLSVCPSVCLSVCLSVTKIY